MNWVTVLIVVVLGFLTYRAYINGFVREMVSLAAVILAIPIAGVLYDDMVPNVSPILDSDRLAALISFLAILGGVIIGGQVVAHLLKRFVRLLNLGAADSLAGAAFGFIKGVLICQVVLVAFVLFPAPDARDEIENSFAANLLLDGTPLALAILPDRFDNSIERFLDGARPTLNGSGNGTAQTVPETE